MTTEVKLIFFAKAREIVGKNHIIIEVNSTISYKDLLKTVVDRFALGDIEKSIILCVNEEYCSASDTLHLSKGDEIAIIPPLSGG